MTRILVVDDSRLVRMALVRNLKGTFDVVEEGDGEAAWQQLLLDRTIKAVVSDLQMPKLDGYGLLQRVRASTQKRLQEIPFIVVSGEETEEEREKARSLGVSDFVTKGAGSAEILVRLTNLLTLAEARENLEASREEMVHDPVSGLYTRKYLGEQATQAYSQTARSGLELCAMVLGFDGYDLLNERLGSELAERVATRFAKMLAGRVRQEDSLGHFGPGRYAIVSPGTSPVQLKGFAERVREAVAAAQIPVPGQQPVSLTVSVGVASLPVDTVTGADALLALAEERMSQAMAAGGNRVCLGEAAEPVLRDLKLAHALEFLAAGRPEPVRPHLGRLGIEVLPLLTLLNQELRLNLPLAEIEQRLRDRVSQNN
jgi:diguanylate cyclase (GGDEF)-like protein